MFLFLDISRSCSSTLQLELQNRSEKMEIANLFPQFTWLRWSSSDFSSTGTSWVDTSYPQQYGTIHGN